MDPAAEAGAKAVAEVRDVVLALAPGFIALKIFQVFGAQTKRSEWEWTAWSVLVAALLTVPPFEYWQQLAAGVVLGFALAVAWRTLPGWPLIGVWAAQNLQNSAWDLALDQVARDKDVIEVAVGEGEAEQRFFGRVKYFGYEQYEAEPWLYLSDPQRKASPTADYARMARTKAVMLHRDSVKWLRVMKPDYSDKGT